jgi:1-acyl-sn-glycerol-3-phosphate acyltransferase
VKSVSEIGGHDAELLTQARRRGVHSTRWVEQQSVFVYRVVLTLLGIGLRFWIRRYRAIGQERVPREGGLFLIANHESGMDPFVISYPVRWRLIRGPGKIELFANPFFGAIMRNLGMFPLRQEVADAGAVRAMVELYRKGRVVLVYPEGGRTDDGNLQPFMPDFARLMLRMKARMLPVGVDGVRELLPIGRYVPLFNAPVAVAFGEVFDLSQFYGQKITDDLAQEVADYLREKVAAMIAMAEQERARL